MKRLAIVAILCVAWKLLGADAVTFNPSISPGVTNHTLYYGPYPSRLVTNRVNLGESTTWTITNVAPATSAFLFATAWAGGEESDPSNEITYTNLQAVMQLTLTLEKAANPSGPYLPLTNTLTYTATVEPNQFYRVRMEAIVLP